MFAPLQNDTFLRACLRQATDYTPVWLMRQAGRYLPEYRATRAKAGSFMGLATNTDYATEVTLQPLERFPLDAAILFSDILTVPDAMGLGLSFALGEGPRFASPVRDEAAVAKLEVPDMDKLRYVFDAVTSIRKALNGRVPLIGFSGSPWTLACYMVEGAGSDDYRLVKTMLYRRPDLMHKMLAINADAVALYLNAQIEAGAQAVMIFDSWGGVLADAAFQHLQPGLHRPRAEPAQARTRRREDSASGVHQGRRPVAGKHEATRLRGARPGLDRESGAGAGARRRERPQRKSPAGQPRPQRAVCQPGPDRSRSGGRAQQLRRTAHGPDSNRPDADFQSGSRHQPAHATR